MGLYVCILVLTSIPDIYNLCLQYKHYASHILPFDITFVSRKFCNCMIGDVEENIRHGWGQFHFVNSNSTQFHSVNSNSNSTLNLSIPIQFQMTLFLD